jgi:hypothetical protein
MASAILSLSLGLVVSTVLFSRRTKMTNNFSKKQLAQEAALNDADLVQIRQCRRDHNRRGFAYQLGFVRLLNRFPRQVPFEILEELLDFISTQVTLSASLIIVYERRQQTISEHQQRIATYLQLRPFGDTETAWLGHFIFEEACRLEQTSALQARVKEFLKSRRILQPAESTLNRLIGEQRQRAQEMIHERITAGLDSEMAAVMDELLQVLADNKTSPLQRIKANPRNPSPDAMLALIKKLKVIEETGVLNIDLSWLNSNYQRALFHYVNKCSADRLREIIKQRRHAALVCFLWQSYRDAIDQAVDMYDKLIVWVHTQARSDLDEQLRKQRSTIQASLGSFKSMGEIILDESVPDSELRYRLFDEIPKDKLSEQIDAVEEWVSGKKSNRFYGVINRFSYLRRFSPVFLRNLEFRAESDEENACLRAVKLLNEINDKNKRKLPEDTPTCFVPKRLRPFIRDQFGNIQKPAWEYALLTQLKDEIRAGNISIEHSKRFGCFDNFFIPNSKWETLRDSFFARANLPQVITKVPDYLRRRLKNAI